MLLELLVKMFVICVNEFMYLFLVFTAISGVATSPPSSVL